MAKRGPHEGGLRHGHGVKEFLPFWILVLSSLICRVQALLIGMPGFFTEISSRCSGLHRNVKS